MTRKTSFDELYLTLGELVNRSTGRPWWRKTGIQSRPNTPYAIVYLVETAGIEKQVVSNTEIEDPAPGDEAFEQTPWGTALLDVRVEFYKSGQNDTAEMAAQRLRAALYLEERYWDIWEIAALSGGVRFLDVSGAFRDDIEPRTELRFQLWANIADPLPLADVNIHEIDSQSVEVIHVRIDGEETEITVPDTE